MGVDLIMSNRDIGHWREAGGPLARRRRAEVQKPVFLFYPDRFEKPNPFRPDVAVSIDSVIEQKLDALVVMVSQFYEGGALGSAALLPRDPAGQEQRRKTVRAGHAERFRANAQRFRGTLAEWYGKEQADKVSFAETFEVCECGRKPDKAELRKLFPVFPE
jgi:LmbE family N-acetylglucosaminyl deacetylase